MENSEKALVSVIITTYHNETYLPRAIESVLHQSYPKIELIVVDDNPPESEARQATEKVMEQYPQVIYLRHSKNKNGAAARNTGIRAARGSYICFLDNDDFYFSNHITNCVNAIEKAPDCGCVLCGVVKICEGICWDMIHAPTGELVKTLLLSETALGTGSNLFIRSSIVRELKGFDESFIRHQDVEFGLRLFERCRACSLDDIQIVKEMSGFSNAPNLEKFFETKKHLWGKFHTEIRCLSEIEQKRYFARQYSALLYVACKENNREQIKHIVSQLKKYRSLNKREQLLLLLSKMHLFYVYEISKKKVKQVKSHQLYAKVIKNKSSYDVEIFKKALYHV